MELQVLVQGWVKTKGKWEGSAAISPGRREAPGDQDWERARGVPHEHI
jgi:hypothetical protein